MSRFPPRPGLAPAILLSPRTARAFTLPSNLIIFDPISVPIDHTLDVHLLNQFSGLSLDFRMFVKPTTGTTRVPVVTVIFVSVTPSPGASPSPPPPDWSGKVANSVEVVDDVTGKQIAVLGGRHIVRNNAAGAPTFCLFCN